jgi:hypothetical protein
VEQFGEMCKARRPIRRLLQKFKQEGITGMQGVVAETKRNRSGRYIKSTKVGYVAQW